jgi:hypothetical protein
VCDRRASGRRRGIALRPLARAAQRLGGAAGGGPKKPASRGGTPKWVWPSKRRWLSKCWTGGRGSAGGAKEKVWPRVELLSTESERWSREQVAGKSAAGLCS